MSDPENGDDGNEAHGIKTRRRRAQAGQGHRFCPHCLEWSLERRRLPGVLRTVRVLLSVIGMDVRAYTCMSCGKDSTLYQRRRPRHS